MSHQITTTDVVVRPEYEIKKSCNCSKCEFESLFVALKLRNHRLTIGGIYRHPSGNIKHFISDLENSLEQSKYDHTLIIAGDLNTDIIQFHVGDVLEYITTLRSAKCLPYIVLQTRITHHSTTCFGNIFVRNNPGYGYQDILGGIFYCEITDHLHNVVSLKSDDAISSTDRPMVKLFG